MVEAADLSSESIDDVTKINNLSTSNTPNEKEIRQLKEGFEKEIKSLSKQIDNLKQKIENERKEHQEELKEVEADHEEEL